MKKHLQGICLLLIVCINTSGQMVLNNKIPLVIENFYQDNNYLWKPSAWIDGNLDQNFIPAWGFLYPAHEIVIDLTDYSPRVNKIRIYDGGGSDLLDTKIYIVRQDNDQELFLGTYTGNAWQQWIEFNVPTSFIASRVLIRGKSGDRYGNELEIIADYTPYVEPSYNRSKQPLRNMFGVNTFWWDLMKNDVNYATNSMYAPKYNRVKEMGISMCRFYMSHSQFQPDSATWSFNPTISDFYTDVLLENCHNDGIEPLLNIMGNPPHIFNTYPDPNPNDGHLGEYVSLVSWPDMPNRHLVSSYLPSAKLGFVVAARYGRNSNIPNSLLESIYPAPNWYTPANMIKKGLGTVNYIEIGNELELGWPDSMNYMTGQMLGPFLSAVYDGHKGTLGPGYGIKTADPTMKVVVAGFGRAATDGYRGIMEWSRKNRGYHADGSVNLPFDVINYHKYSTDGNLDQYGVSTMGLPPEMSGVLQIADEFIQYSNKHAQGKEVWLSEWGYDYHPQSVFRAPSYGNKSAFEVTGAWAIRSILTYAAHGIDRMHWFKLFNNYEWDGSVTQLQFNSMSLLDDEFSASNHTNTNPVYPRRIVGDYFAQMKDFHDYHFDGYVVNNDLKVMRLLKGDSVAYAIWHVEASSGTGASRTFSEVTGTYELSLPTNPLIKLKQLKPGALKMDSSIIQVGNGVYFVNYGMKPVFIEIGPSFMVLPVSFTSFDVSCSEDSIHLQWNITNETDLSHFVIQGSSNGYTWADLFSTTRKSAALVNGKFFRMAAVHHDGRRSYSRTERVDCRATVFVLYPNPVTDYLNLQLETETSTKADIYIRNSKGALILHKTEILSTGFNSFKIDMKKFPAGMYVVDLEVNNDQRSYKFVKN